MPAPGTARHGRATAPGTCGELAQGMLDGVICLATCPIDMYSTAAVELWPGEGLVTAPDDSPKAARAVQATLEYLDATGLDARLALESNLPRGKGMASSTADVSAAIAATASATGRKLTPVEVAGVALSVEPSDGIMFPGIVVFDHRNGSICRPLGQPPPMGVVVLDFGGEVDTLEFNSVERDNALRRQEPRMTEAVSLIEAGIRRCDPSLIGRGATISSVANQEISYNPHLDSALELLMELGAYGVNIAHSGTVIGLLLPDQRSLQERAASLAWEGLDGLEALIPCRLAGGGVRVH